MVQIHRLGRSDKCDQFWKMQPYLRSGSGLRAELRRRNIYFVPSAKPRRLVAILHRSDRGLLNYETCHSEDLKTFVQQRHLTAADEQGVLRLDTKRKLVTLLEQVDEDTTFPRLLELPAELRDRIYELHITDIVTNVDGASNQPPLTLVCRQLRNETLPIFYNKSTFILFVDIRPSGKPVFSTCTRHLLANLSSSNISEITKLYVYCATLEPQMLSEPALAGVMRAFIQVYHHSHQYTLSEFKVGVMDLGEDSRREKLAVTSIEEKLRAVLNGIVVRPRAKKLEREDFERLRDVFDLTHM